MSPVHLLAGAAAGAAGALGLGSGTVLLICLSLLEVDRLAASGINLLFFPVTGGLSLWLHHRQGLVCWPVALPLALAGCAGAALGCWAAGMVPRLWLSRLFGAMLAGLGLRELAACRKKPPSLYKPGSGGAE